MGILDRLKQLATTPEAKSHSPNGSEYAPNYAVEGSLPSSSLAGKFSPLHAINNGALPSTEGYSLNGNYVAAVMGLYFLYDDGQINTLPKPSKLNDPQSTEYNDLQLGTTVTVLYTSKNNYLNSLKEK
jgi:hypothetical protein